MPTRSSPERLGAGTPRGLRAAAAVLSAIVPPCCAACRLPVPRAATLCGGCSSALPRITRSCVRCALPAHGARACPAARSAVDAAWAPFAHEGPARDVVLGLKLAGRLPLAAWMARRLAEGLPTAPAMAGAGAVLVPVPPSPSRRRRRGFDPAALLAAELGRATGRPVAAVLRRRDRAPRQVGAGRDTRRAGGRILVEAVDAPPRSALLVDDVHTTGATLDACARALKSAGCERVCAVTFARSL